MCHVYKPVERGVGLAGPFRFRPEYFLLLDVIVDADAVLDINDRREVAVVLVLRVDVQVNDFVLLDDHQEGVVLLDADPGAVDCVDCGRRDRLSILAALNEGPVL